VRAATGHGTVTKVHFGVLVQAVDAPDAFLGAVRLVEDLGFEYLWVADSSLHARDVYAYLTLAATASRRLRLGTGITHPVTRHPGVTANAIATLADLSGGRAVLGVGAGDRPVRELGVAPAPVGTVREMVLALRRLLAGEEISGGSAFRFDHARLRYPPRYPIPIYVAASGPRMLALAGEIADGVVVQAGTHPACVGAALRSIREGAARRRADGAIDIAVLLYGSVREDEQLAREEARPFAAWIPQTAPRYCDIAGVDPAATRRVRELYRGGELHEAVEAAAAATDEMIDAFTLAGSPGRCRALVGRLVEMGVRHIEFFPMGADRVGGLRRFAADVMSAFR